MGAIKEFIKEHSPTPEVPKKRRRVRLKNFNPFRKRKYKVLNEDTPESAEQHPRNAPPLAEDQRKSSLDHASTNYSKAKKQKRRTPRELFQAACGSLGFAKGDPDDPNHNKRNKARKHGYECLAEEENLEGTAAEGHVKADAESLDSLSESDGEGRCEEKKGSAVSAVKRVAIADEIEVIDTVEEAPPQKKKKKKSVKKKIKKAGIKTAKFIGQGVTNMAVTYQYMSPEAAMAPVTKEIARLREERYREMCSLAYVITASV
ncbi:uncharacterized protein LOC110976759 [Acanthaster planci]|uniref:Uncharacterized protein LOC110976759 n=1 Tax=Acanthaster planci TaxID=133434 RepID=A0A8B7Y147_ACAPL|nr:uncharacterized protein LOC110976759 [Acanthaster planci]